MNEKGFIQRIIAMLNVMITCISLMGVVLSCPMTVKADGVIRSPRISEDGTVSWDIVQFGNYYINNGNEKEPIEWRVLSVDGDVALLLADKAIDYLFYGDNEEDIEWESSTLRKWLNNANDGFIKEAFTLEEQNDIKHIVFDGNDVNIDNNNSSEDMVFLPSRQEMINTAYGFEGCRESKTRAAKPTDYAKSKMVDGDVDENGYCMWWLRTEPGYNKFDLLFSDGLFSIGETGLINIARAVRPAMYVNVNSDYIKLISETTSNVDLNDELYQLDGRHNYKVTYYSDEGYLHYYSSRKVADTDDGELMEIYIDGGTAEDKSVIANLEAGKIVSCDAWGGDYEGHSLLGWTTEGDDTLYVMYGYGLGEGQKYLHEYVVKKDVTFKAVWIDNSVQEANDDPVPSAQEEDKKVEDTVDSVPTSSGGTTVPSTKTRETSSSTSGEKQTAIEVKSVETPSETSLSREIIFHSDKGYIFGQADNIEVKYTTLIGSKISNISEIRDMGVRAYCPDYYSMPNGKYKGYVFKGWKAEGDDNVYWFPDNVTTVKVCSTFFEFPNETDEKLDVNTDYVVTDDVTFEAVWEWEEQYQVTFELEKDDEWYYSWVRCNNNELLNNYAVPINNDYVCDHRIFKGWKIEEDNTLYVTDKDNVAENEKYIGDYVVTGPVTFEAVWEDDSNVDDNNYIPSNISMDANLNITYDGRLDGDRYYYGDVEIKNAEGNYDYVYSFGGRGWIPLNWYNQMPNAFITSGDYRIRIRVVDQNENEEYSDYYEFSWEKPKQSLSIPQNVRWSESKYGVATCYKVENAYAYYYEFFMDGESIGGGWTYDAEIPDFDYSSSIEEYGREHRYTFRVMALVEEPDKYAHSIWSDESPVLGDTSESATEKDKEKNNDTPKEAGSNTNNETADIKQENIKPANENQKTDEFNKVQPNDIGGILTDIDGNKYVIKNDDSVSYESAKDEDSSTINIPSVVILNGREYKITKISDGAFSKNTSLKKVAIGSNIETIGAKAFSGCSNLTSISMNGNSLKTIEAGAFENCKKLSRITLGKNVVSIGKNAFKGDKKLRTITIKSTKIKTIGKNAFKNINNKAKIYVPKSLSKKQFAKYKKILKKVGFPKTVKIKKK